MADIPTDISVKELFTEVAPNITKEALASSGAAGDLAGTEFTMVMDLSGEMYSYVVKDGKDFDVKEGSMDNPMVLVKVDKEVVENMIKTQNLDMLLGIQSDLNKTKYDALKSLKGSIVAELTNDDGSVVKIETILNGTAAPQAIFKMKMSDSTALVRKETSPVNLFMSGAMKIEGDMAFAMSTQSLFS